MLELTTLMIFTWLTLRVRYVRYHTDKTIVIKLAI